MPRCLHCLTSTAPTSESSTSIALPDPPRCGAMKSTLTAIGAVTLALVVLAHSTPLAEYVQEEDVADAEQTAMDGSGSGLCQKKTGGGKSNLVVRIQNHRSSQT
eukprot:SAG31_NODE_426_length_15814_cov_25.737066_6_plen_104_part_00